MDDPTTHEDDANVAHPDDGVKTPADTQEAQPSEGEPKTGAEEAKAAQKDAWLSKIKEGTKSLDDMPENLGWLKKEIQEDLGEAPAPKPIKRPDLSSEVRLALREERAADDFDDLIDDLAEADLSAEQDAQLKLEYEDLLEDFENPLPSQKLKALNKARRLVGIKNFSEVKATRRRRGRVLPPTAGKKRSVVSKQKETEIEKKLAGNLPPNF